MAEPLVSVVIPAYNCERFIRQAVQSCQAQTVQELEIIIIDDASTDGTGAVLADLAGQDERIRLLRNDTNMGVAQTRNRGFTEARGTFTAFLDGDDLWLPEKLEKQLLLMRETGCALCYTGYTLIGADGRAVGRPYQVPASVTLPKLVSENVIGCSSVLCRTELLKQHPMRPEYAHEDYVLWLELLRAGQTARGVQQPLMQYRVLSGSRSVNKVRAAQNRWRIYRQFLGLPLPKAAAAFGRYAVRGFHKHRHAPDRSKRPE